MQWTYECLAFDMLVPDMMETMALLTIQVRSQGAQGERLIGQLG